MRRERRRRAAQVPPGGTHLCSLCDESFDDSLAALADDRLAP